MVDSIATSIDSVKEEMADTLCRLVEFESLTCHEGDVVCYVQNKMGQLGYEEVLIDRAGNVAGRVGSGPGVLVIDAHLDVVDAEGQQWSTPPFTPVRNQGRIAGRGTVDDKGPFTAALFAGKLIRDLGLAEHFTVYIVGSIAEEDCEGLALGEFLEEFSIVPDYVVIAESSNLQICRGHRGRAQVQAVFTGIPVHASRHGEGINPIELAQPFLAGVQELDARFDTHVFVNPLGRADIAAVDVRCVSNSLSTTPYQTTVIMDRRTTTDDTRESILEEIRALANADLAEIGYVGWKAVGYNGHVLESEEYFPAWVLEEEHPLIQAAKKAYAACPSLPMPGKSVLPGTAAVVTDALADEATATVGKSVGKGGGRGTEVGSGAAGRAEEVATATWGFSTNGNYTMGRKGYPTIGFGPGRMELCHGPNEYIEIDDMAAASEFFVRLAAELELFAAAEGESAS